MATEFSQNYRDQIERAHGLENYVKEKTEVRKPLLDRVRRYTPDNGVIIEWGSGTGVLSAQLAREGYRCTSLELDPQMITLQQEICAQLHATVNLVRGDIRNFKLDDMVDTSFNNGVLEHFNEDEIVALINHIVMASRIFIFGVPTFFNRGNLIGDERLWTYWRWKEIIGKTDGQLIEAFSFFSRRKIREKINRLLGCKLYPVSTGVGFVLRNPNAF